ncbi:UNVERIFIED_CONTAM: hypothetical protein PYX00_007220 [Menopon gallinae]|uniref:GlcNAc-PI synthesis protein n=1 Tax=Menopon gallinae TaxID=328185 RepID=A0AAW2HIV3_9NEOP
MCPNNLPDTKENYNKMHRICMASDFFYPNMGGVEENIFNLSQCLISAGHKTFYNQCVLPTMICSLPLIRFILIRERITIVHGHSAFSALAHESMIIARLLGLKTVFTDHSLFGFADTSAVITNKFLEISLADCNHCICVSHTGKENTVLRARVSTVNVSVIPNAVDATLFTPDYHFDKTKDPINVVVISRLVYRKGIDLLADIVPEICSKYKNVNFIIGGDGPKRGMLEEMREKGLQDRMTLLGKLEHTEVRNVLIQGQIFLNCSVTEAYCMAIVEAASCGLQVVSTNVGGIPEVLPPNLLYLTDPNATALTKTLEQAIEDLLNDRRPTEVYKTHEIVKSLYNWVDVSQRTVLVYNRIAQESPTTLAKQLRKYMKTRVLPWLLVISLMYIIIKFLEWYIPEKDIDVAEDYKIPRTLDERKPRGKYNRKKLPARISSQ